VPPAAPEPARAYAPCWRRTGSKIWRRRGAAPRCRNTPAPVGVLISSGSPERELFHDPTCCRRHHVCYRWRIHCGATSKRPVARSCPACPRAVWAGLGAATISVVTTELCVCGASRRIQVSRWRASVASNRPSSLTASARRLPWVGFARRNLGAARRSRPSSPSS
jgi:hypothetical protein